MPQPEIKQGDAQQHRDEDTDSDGDDDPAARVEAEAGGGADEDGGLEVEATTGGDDGDPDDGDEPDYADNSDDGGGFGLLRNKKVVALIVIAAVVGLYWLYVREQMASGSGGGGGGQGNGNRGGTSPQSGASLDREPESVDDVVDAATYDEPPERTERIPQDDSDPLKADEYVLNNSGIFPSISGDAQSGQPAEGGDDASAAG